MVRAGEALATVPHGYTILLPPGWIRVSLSQPLDKAVEDITDRMFARLQRDAFPAERRKIEETVREIVRKAKADNGIDLYLPVEELHGVTVAASFIVGGLFMQGEVDALAALTLSGQLAADGSLADIDGSVGARVERTQAADAARGEIVDVATRHVDYAFPIPNDDRRWLTVTFSTPGGGVPDDQVADALVELFDAMMSTFAWKIQ
ncbi:hypothetical protein [Catenulispora pinisilvae]|uniref:hypothetical protein n=1 Tax=Catenulispora pinisilvae TaxID=2705253 RepID=UPI00189277B5|nr:hypothetical protein [Catenulispora pinisilvae]